MKCVLNPIKKETSVQLFSCAFYEIFRDTYFVEYRTNAVENQRLSFVQNLK